MKIVTIDPGHPDIITLLQQSDEYMASLYPPQSNHMESIANLRSPNVAFLGATMDGVVVGCGGVKLQDEGERYGEIKRLFVAEAHRGKGVATEIILHLEEHLLKSGVTLARLEVGVKQPSAIALYEQLGYKQRGPFGSYRADLLSVFMEKRMQIVPLHTQ